MYPKTAIIKRGGKYRRAYFIQPYAYADGTYLAGVHRIVFMEI